MDIVRYEVDRPKSLILNVMPGINTRRSWTVEGALEIQSCDPVYSIPVRVFASTSPRAEQHVADFEIYLLTRNTSDSWFKCDTETPFLFTFISEFAPFGTIKPQFLYKKDTPNACAHLVAAFSRIQVLPEYRKHGIATAIIESLSEIAQLCAGIPLSALSDNNIDFLAISTYHASDKSRIEQWLIPKGYSWATKRNHRWLIKRAEHPC